MAASGSAAPDCDRGCTRHHEDAESVGDMDRVLLLFSRDD